MIQPDFHRVWWGLFNFLDEHYDFYLVVPKYKKIKELKFKNEVKIIPKLFCFDSIIKYKKIITEINPSIVIAYHFFNIHTQIINLYCKKKIVLF